MKNLKVNELEIVNSKEMQFLKGGGEPGDCCCSCWAQNSGGSSTSDNDGANDKGGLHSKYGCLPTVKVVAEDKSKN
jgi:hypothetical protein